MKNDARIGYTGRPGMPNWPENRELLTSQQPDEVKIPFSFLGSWKCLRAAGCYQHCSRTLFRAEPALRCADCKPCWAIKTPIPCKLHSTLPDPPLCN